MRAVRRREADESPASLLSGVAVDRRGAVVAADVGAWVAPPRRDVLHGGWPAVGHGVGRAVAGAGVACVEGGALWGACVAFSRDVDGGEVVRAVAGVCAVCVDRGAVGVGRGHPSGCALGACGGGSGRGDGGGVDAALPLLAHVAFGVGDCGWRWGVVAVAPSGVDGRADDAGASGGAVGLGGGRVATGGLAVRVGRWAGGVGRALDLGLLRVGSPLVADAVGCVFLFLHRVAVFPPRWGVRRAAGGFDACDGGGRAVGGGAAVGALDAGECVGDGVLRGVGRDGGGGGRREAGARGTEDGGGDAFRGGDGAARAFEPDSDFVGGAADVRAIALAVAGGNGRGRGLGRSAARGCGYPDG